MSTFRRYKEYSLKDCIKTNAITAIVFAIIYGAMFSIYNYIMNMHKQNRFDLSHEMDIIENAILSGFVLFLILGIYIMMMPLLVGIYSKFTNNIKSFICIWICSLISAQILFDISGRKELAISYVVTSILGSFISLIFKYLYIEYKNVENSK